MICKFKYCHIIYENGCVTFYPNMTSCDFYEDVIIEIDEDSCSWKFQANKREFWYLRDFMVDELVFYDEDSYKNYLKKCDINHPLNNFSFRIIESKNYFLFKTKKKYILSGKIVRNKIEQYLEESVNIPYRFIWR